MLSIDKIGFIKYAQSVDERSSIIAEIFVDTSDELPAVDDIEGYTLHQGSVAYVIRTGEFYVLDSGGKWCLKASGASADGGESDGNDKISNEEIDEIIQSKPGDIGVEIDADEISSDDIDSLF